MMRCRKIVAISLLLATAAVHTANAAAIRLDSGGWTDGIFVDDGSSTTTALGFGMNFFGSSGDTITVNADGSVALSAGGGPATATFNPLFEPGMSSGTESVQYTISTTLDDGSFNQPGVEAGVRIQWNHLRFGGTALGNVFQMSMFELTNGQFAVEFNYERVVFGSDDTTGFGWSAVDTDFNLLDELGNLAFSDILGIGALDPENPNPNFDECLEQTALPCNNFFNGVWDPSNLILPDIANGYFRSLSGTDDTPVQGRYLWLSGAVATPEPSILLLLALGVLAWAIVSTLRQRRPRK